MAYAITIMSQGLLGSKSVKKWYTEDGKVALFDTAGEAAVLAMHLSFGEVVTFPNMEAVVIPAADLKARWDREQDAYIARMCRQ